MGELMKEEQAAALLRVAVKTLQNWRTMRTRGPGFYKVGGAVRYDKTELLQYKNTH